MVETAEQTLEFHRKSRKARTVHDTAAARRQTHEAAPRTHRLVCERHRLIEEIKLVEEALK